MRRLEQPRDGHGQTQPFDVIVVGGGQSALAVGYYLRRTALSYVVLDDQREAGGAWQHTWRSLRLFSPAQWSSLPGRLMPGGTSYYPTRDEALDYLRDYETRYAIPVQRPVRVFAVSRDGELLRVRADGGDLTARAVVSATGTWSSPNVPRVPGDERYRGTVIHSGRYDGGDEFLGRRIVVVGGGNSGAQIVADLFDRASVTWATRSPPRFLPDDIDGRYLFGEASARYRVMTEGGTVLPPRTLGDIVMVESVRRARERGALVATPMFTSLTEDGVEWPDGRRTREDAVIFATGFRPALDHLGPLGVAEPNGRIRVGGTRAVREPRVWLVGYGDWTGYASATLIGVGRTARATVEEIGRALDATVGDAAG
jgi:cation diffusion facilitator CzcD-associated flavoprotein CzcO